MNVEVLMDDTEDLIIEGEISTDDVELNGYLDYRGPKGEKGEKGDKGDKGDQGLKGDKGDQGTGINILGSYNSLEELELAHPTGNLGDSYLIDGYLYIWNEIISAWENVGAIQGPKGDKGDTGVQGEQGPKGEKGDKGDKGDTGAQGEQGPKGEDGAAIDGDTLPIGGIIEYNGTAVPEGYEKVSESYENVYSTSETIIGKYLGKNLYRKVFSIDNSSCTFYIGATNDPCFIINKYGYILYTHQFENKIAFPGDEGFDVSIDFRYQTVEVTLGSNMSDGEGELIVEYIKQGE